MRNDVIRIKNATFYAYHGVLADEQNHGGKFEVDVEIRADLSSGITQDSLKRTLDYEKLYAVIQSTVTAKRYYLIETLADTILKNILREFPQVDDIVVRVRKPHPPIKGVVDYVEVEVSEKR
ncbi:MAG: dihydroneopterin aldolase [Bacteroidetes bacterium]|nr:MAG: dihydroneopterin aldolase [Bacteroidota bacterium]